MSAIPDREVTGVPPFYRPQREDFLRLLTADVADVHRTCGGAGVEAWLASIIQSGSIDAGFDPAVAGHALAVSGPRRPWLLEAIDAGGADLRGVLSAHREAMGTVEKSRFRDKLSIVGVRSAEGHGFVAPEYDVRAEIAWMLERATARPTPLPSLVAAVLFHFLHVHPFVDGNGRVSRVLLPRVLIAVEGRARLALVLFALAHFQVEKAAFVRALFQERVAGGGAFLRYVTLVLERGGRFLECVGDLPPMDPRTAFETRREAFLAVLASASWPS